MKRSLKAIVLSCVITIFTILYLTPAIEFNFILPNLQNFQDNVSEGAYFKDKYFERILTTFQRKYSVLQNPREHFRSGDIPTFLVMPPIKKGQNKFWKEAFVQITSNECPLPCRYTYNLKDIQKADAVVFHLKFLKGKKFVQDIIPDRDLKQPWVMLSFEAPLLGNSRHHTDYREFNNLFNRTMSARKDCDIIMTHGFVVKKEDASYLPYNWRIPPENITLKSRFRNDTAVVGLISNCVAKSRRLDYVRELNKYIAVDIYGKCGTLKCGHSLYVGHRYKPNSDKCLRKIGGTYLFYLAFENSICKDYGTEKIYNLLYYPMVPIVLGGINYEELLPPNSYINAADYSPSDLAKYLNFLMDNSEEYQKLHKWRERFVPSTVGGARIMCDLCTRLYDATFYEHNVVKDFYKWFYTDAKCERKWTIDNKYNLTYQ